MSELRKQCTRCGERIRPGREVWLEMNTRTLRYTLPGLVPPAESQGAFPFGGQCASVVLTNEGRCIPKEARNGRA